MSRLAIEGTCLCQAVQVGVQRRPRTLTSCNCSVCRRYGTLWAYYTRSSVTITAPRGGLMAYSVRRGGLRFVRCKTCGCVINWERAPRAPDQRIGLNARMLDHARIADVPISVLDGDKTWRILDRHVLP